MLELKAIGACYHNRVGVKYRHKPFDYYQKSANMCKDKKVIYQDKFLESEEEEAMACASCKNTTLIPLNLEKIVL